MRSVRILQDCFDRVATLVPAVLDGLTADDVRWQPGPGANSIGWLIWHLTRVQDDHIAGVAGAGQVYADWAESFALPYGNDIGFGMSADQIAAFRVSSPELLSGYHAAVHHRTTGYLASLTDDDFDRIVDESWDPPVTLAVRLVSVINETAQHVGQAGYVRGLLERATGRSSFWRGYAG